MQILNCRGQPHQHKITVLFDFSTDGDGGGDIKLGRHTIMGLFPICKVESWYRMTRRDNNGVFLSRNVDRRLSIGSADSE